MHTINDILHMAHELVIVPIPIILCSIPQLADAWRLLQRLAPFRRAVGLDLYKQARHQVRCILLILLVLMVSRAIPFPIPLVSWGNQNHGFRNGTRDHLSRSL